jgi:hypothetical protein
VSDGETEDRELDADGNADISTADTMTERTEESAIKLYVLMKANRLGVALTLVVVVFLTLVLMGQFLFPDFYTDVASGDTIETVFSTMLGAIITGTTLVVTISQLVLSQENGPLGDQHERMSSSMDFRDYLGDLLGKPIPADPSAFLRIIVEETEDRANRLRKAISGSDDSELVDQVDEFTESVTGNADQVREELDGATFGEFDVLYSALDFNYGYKIFQTERIEHNHDDVLSANQRARFDELRTILSMFGPAREHVKTLYFQWALIDLSQLILYAAIPALLVAAGMLTFVGANTVTGTTLGVQNIVLLTAGAFSITVLPFMLLVSYIARIATVAKRTLAIGPLILRESQR